MARTVTPWTYTNAPRTDDKDAVRFLIGDVDPNNKLVTDDEILWALDQFSNVYNAAALICDQIASEQSSDGLKQIGDLRISGSRSATSFTAKAKTFRRLASLGATPYAGGISAGDAQTYQLDSDIPSPAFAIGQFDSPEAPDQGGVLTLNSTST